MAVKDVTFVKVLSEEAVKEVAVDEKAENDMAVDKVAVDEEVEYNIIRLFIK